MSKSLRWSAVEAGGRPPRLTMTLRGGPLPPDGVMDELDLDKTAVPCAAATVILTGPPTAAAAPTRGATVGIGSARRAAIGSSPGTEKGRRMRSQLLLAARKVFERDGYLNARVADIAAAAGASHGSFYTYFESKTEIFRCLVADEMEGLYRTLGTAASTGTDQETTRGEPRAPGGPWRTVEELVDGIEGANRRFLEMYQQNTALLGLFEQVTSFDDEVRVLRMRVRRRMVDRVTSSIRKMQEDGQVSTALDAHYSASILVSMVNSIMHHWLVVREPFEGELLVRTLTQLWAGALGLPVAPDRWGPLPPAR